MPGSAVRSRGVRTPLTQGTLRSMSCLAVEYFDRLRVGGKSLLSVIALVAWFIVVQGLVTSVQGLVTFIH